MTDKSEFPKMVVKFFKCYFVVMLIHQSTGLTE